MLVTLTARQARRMLQEVEPIGRSAVSPTLSKLQAKMIYEAALDGLPDMHYLPCGLAEKIKKEFGEQITEQRLLERGFEARNGRGVEYWKSGERHALCVKFLDGSLLKIRIVQGNQVVQVRRDVSLSELESLHTILG